jgi:hypothetical protein
LIKFGLKLEKNGSKDTENEKKSAKNCHFFKSQNQSNFIPRQKKKGKNMEKITEKGGNRIKSINKKCLKYQS